MNEVTIEFTSSGGDVFSVTMDDAWTGALCDNGSALIDKAVEAIKRAACITSQ